MAIPIVVVGKQRSGTTVFRRLLAVNGAADYGEIFHAQFSNTRTNFYWYLHQLIQENPLLLHPTKHPRLFKAFVEERLLNTKAPHALIDIKYNALRLVDGGLTENTPSTIRLLADHGAKFLHINRKNKLRAYTSALVAEKTGKWSEAGDQQLSSEEKQVRVPPRRAVEAISSHCRVEELVNEWLKGLDVHFISYEDMFSPSGAFSDQALTVASNLLGIPVGRDSCEKVDLRKQNPEPLERIVSNFEELRHQFQNTPYAWMIDAA